MTRKKVKLAYITNDSARKATYKKRKKGLMKKVNELSTLCGIEACAIIYSPYESQPEVWPSPGGVQHVLSRFKKLSEMEQSKKMVNQESFLRSRIVKSNEQLKKQCKENREKEITQVMFQNLVGKGGLNNLNMLDLNDLGSLIEQNLKDIQKRFDTLGGSGTAGGEAAQHNSQGSSSSSSMTAAAAPSVTITIPEATPRIENKVQEEMMRPGLDQMKMDMMQQRPPQWVIDMMNGQDHVGFGGNEMMLPLMGDNAHTALWSNAFFPWEK